MATHIPEFIYNNFVYEWDAIQGAKQIISLILFMCC